VLIVALCEGARPVSTLTRAPWRCVEPVDSKKSLDRLPEDVKDVFGSALRDVQYGETPDGAKPFGEGLPDEIWKIVEDFDGDTYRAVYTTFPEVVYVLDAFMKRSKSGLKTSQADKDRVRDRFKVAKRDYDEHHRKREE
jgi:phage-related protein